MMSGCVTHRYAIFAIVLLLAGMTSVCYSGGRFDVAEVIPLPSPAPPSRILSPAPSQLYVPDPVSPSSAPDNLSTPQIALPAVPPQFIYVPKLGFYVAIGTPYDIAYLDSEYFMFRDGFWYGTGYYGGPLLQLEPSTLPSPLVRHDMKEFRRLRDVEFRRYNRDPAHYKARLHSPAAGKDDQQDTRRKDHERHDMKDGD